MTYEYLCTACGHAWEAEQSISAAPLRTCPSCQNDTAKRQVSGGAGFILKGGGWYADLYGSAPQKSSDEAKPEAKDGAKGEGAGKSDASTAKGSGGSTGSSGGSTASGSTSGGSAGGASSGGSTTGTTSAA